MRRMLRLSDAGPMVFDSQRRRDTCLAWSRMLGAHFSDFVQGAAHVPFDGTADVPVEEAGPKTSLVKPPPSGVDHGVALERNRELPVAVGPEARQLQLQDFRFP